MFKELLTDLKQSKCVLIGLGESFTLKNQEDELKYIQFYKTLKEKGISTYKLINEYGISRSLLDRLKHDKPISTVTLNDLCNILHCKVEDVIIHTEDEFVK